MPPTPTGQVRTVATSDLFFSTTDAKGVVDGANSVFCRYAAYEMDELLGKPHNLIRHDDMPGGAFHVMWDLLEHGRPMAAYVKNLAHDGAAYWVFATITPLGSGYLSVRQTPSCTDLWHAADGLYQSVRPRELAVRQEGASRAESARFGAGLLAGGLADLGFATYDDFVRHALPAEVAARRAQVRWTEPRATDPRDGTTAELLAAAADVDRTLDDLDGLDDLATRLADGSESFGATLEQLRAAVDGAAVASAAVQTDQPVLARFIKNLTTLTESLDETGVMAASRVVSTTTTLRSLAAELDVVDDLMHTIQHELATWRLLITRYRLSDRLDSYTTPIDDQLRDDLGQMAAVRQLAAECLVGSQPFDPGALTQAVTTVRRLRDVVALESAAVA